jgi:uncharacterized membrane protein
LLADTQSAGTSWCFVKRDHIGRGIALGALAYSLFSLHDATNKWLVASLPVWQVLFFRSGVIVLGCLAIGRRPLVRRLAATRLRWPLAARAALTLTAWLAYYTAARTLPLAQLLTLYFSAPIMTTLLAIPLLGERVSGARWVSVLLGFIGVLIVGRTTNPPSQQEVSGPRRNVRCDYRRIAEAFSARARRRGAPIRSEQVENLAVGPRHLNSSTFVKSGASVRSVASFLNNNACSRRSPRTCGGKSSILP